MLVEDVVERTRRKATFRCLMNIVGIKPAQFASIMGIEERAVMRWGSEKEKNALYCPPDDAFDILNTLRAAQRDYVARAASEFEGKSDALLTYWTDLDMYASEHTGSPRWAMGLENANNMLLQDYLEDMGIKVTWVFDRDR